MAFFGDLGKKISLAGEGAVSKGRAFVDVARLNSLTSEEEKKIDNAYYQIGKLYVTLHPKNYEDDFGALIGSIISSQERISELKQQIQGIRGVTRCEKCGAEVPDNVAFCSACGSPTPKKEAAVDENHIRCSSCGAIIDKNLRFCTSCGKPLVKPVQAAVQEDAPDGISSSQQESGSTAASEKKCPSCGAVVNSEFAFCVECGTPLN